MTWPPPLALGISRQSHENPLGLCGRRGPVGLADEPRARSRPSVPDRVRVRPAVDGAVVRFHAWPEDGVGYEDGPAAVGRSGSSARRYRLTLRGRSWSGPGCADRRAVSAIPRELHVDVHLVGAGVDHVPMVPLAVIPPGRSPQGRDGHFHGGDRLADRRPDAHLIARHRARRSPRSGRRSCRCWTPPAGCA